MGKEIRKKGDIRNFGGKRLAALSVGLRCILTAIVFILYLSTNSTALLSHVVHSLTDIIAGILVIAGIYLSGKKSERFPWGLYKLENIVAVIIGGLLFFSSYEIGKMIYKPSRLGMKNLDISLAVLFFMIFPTLFFSQYERTRAKVLNSPSLTADAESWRMDVAPLAVVAAGIAGARFSYQVMDKIAAGLMVIVIIVAGYRILRDSLKSLLDVSVDKTTLDVIQDIVKAFSEVKAVSSLQARNSGRFVFINIDLSFSLTHLKDAHEVANRIEKEIKDRIPFVERIVIHYEPERKSYQRYAVPVANKDEEISEHFGSAPFIALWDENIPDGTVISQEIVENPFVEMEIGKGIKLAEFLVKKGVDILYTKENFKGRGPEFVFSDAEVEIKNIDVKNLQDLIKS